MHRLIRTLSALALILATTACVTTPPDPRLLNDAEAAIRQAENAGAEEYAPLELRFARERLEAAQFQLDNNNADAARRASEEAAIEAQLALARTQAAQARAELTQRERDLERLRTDIAEAFGEEVLEP